MYLIAATRKPLAAALLAAGLCASPGLAQDSPVSEQDRANIDTLYREKLSTVHRTRSTADDMTLAQEMVVFAENLPDKDVGASCLIYAHVIDLASTASDLGLMREAYDQLEDRWPEQDLISPDQLMQLGSRAYRGVDRASREQQGEHYIDLLLLIAERYEEANDAEQAIGVCRLASTVARSIGSDRLDPIVDKLERLSSAANVAKRIKMLELSVQKNPQNSPAARELVKLLVTQNNDPVRAAAYVESTGDEELIDLVKRCALGVDVANAATAMRVGDWYLSLAEDEDGERALTLLEESRKWYEQFFALYERDDALARRVADMDNLVLLKIERLIDANPKLDGQTEPDWVALTQPPYDVKQHLQHDPKSLSVDDGRITIDDGMFYVPFNPGRSYEVRITMTVPMPESEHEDRSIFVQLPVGEKRFYSVRLYVKGGVVGELDDVEDKIVINDAPDRIGQTVQYTLQLSQTDREVGLAILHNGKLATSWKGAPEQLEQRLKDDMRNLPLERGSVLAIRSLTTVTIHAVEFKSRD